MKRFVVAGLLGLVLVVAGCGGDATQGSARAEPVTVTVGIADGKAKPAVQRVEIPEGATVTVQVTSDVPVEVHVHGFDKYIRLDKPGTGVVTFTANQTGVFEIETHDTDILLGQLAVQ